MTIEQGALPVWFFALAALTALLGLAYVATPDVPRITGTVAFIVTLAAFGLAVLH